MALAILDVGELRLLLAVGALVLIDAVGAGNADFYLNLFLFTVVSLFVTVIAGIAHDLRFHRPCLPVSH